MEKSQVFVKAVGKKMLIKNKVAKQQELWVKILFQKNKKKKNKKILYGLCYILNYYKFIINCAKSYKLKSRYRRKSKIALISICKNPYGYCKRFFRYKGRYGIIHMYIKRLGMRKFKKFIYKFFKFITKVNYLWFILMGVVGRGMSVSLWKRKFFRDGGFFFRKKSRRNSKKCYSELKIRMKNKKKLKRKKKKVYTRHVYNINRFITKKLVSSRLLTRLGERGHLTLKLSNKVKIIFKKKNALYKVISLFSTMMQKKKLITVGNTVIQKKVFGPYKVKGLKFLGQKGRLREGKSRKL